MTDPLHTPPSPGGRKTGRPAKPESEKLKNVMVRMTDLERQEAESKASEVGLSLSAYLRARTIGAPLKAVVPAINREAYGELARLAGNLNQISHHLNAKDGDDLDLIVLRSLIDDLTKEVKILRLSLLGVITEEGDDDR